MNTADIILDKGEDKTLKGAQPGPTVATTADGTQGKVTTQQTTAGSVTPAETTVAGTSETEGGNAGTGAGAAVKPQLTENTTNGGVTSTTVPPGSDGEDTTEVLTPEQGVDLFRRGETNEGDVDEDGALTLEQWQKREKIVDANMRTPSKREKVADRYKLPDSTIDAGYRTIAPDNSGPLDYTKAEDVYRAVRHREDIEGGAVEETKSPYDEELEEERELDRQRTMTYKDMLSAIDREQGKLNIETPEEKKKREKQERTRKIIAAVGDGITSLANLYFTTKGSLNMYDSKNSLSGKTRARIEQLKTQREADEAKNLKLIAQKYGLIDDLLKEKRTARKTQLELRLKGEKALQDAKLAEARARMYASRGEVYAAQVEKENALALKAQGEAVLRQAQAEWLPQEKQAVINKNNQQAGAAAASANLSRTRAAHVGSGGGGGSRGGGGKGPKSVGTLADTPYYNTNDYNVGIEEKAEEYNVPTTEKKVSTNQYGETTTRIVRRPRAAIANDINKKARQRQQQQRGGTTPAKKPVNPAGGRSHSGFRIKDIK